MKLIIMLFALGLERYLSVGSMMARFNWFSRYLTIIQDQYAKINLNNYLGGWLTVLAVILPIPIIAAIVVLIFGGILKGLVGILLNVAILIYCFGPEDFFKSLQGDAVNSITFNNVFIEANQRIFSVLFWFTLFGPFGALFYRVTVEVTRAIGKGEFSNEQAPKFEMLKGILEWPTSRLFSVIFALVGDFMRCFTFWLDHVLSGVEENDKIISETGAMALQGRNDNASANALIDRTLIIYVALVLVFTLGAFIY